MNDLAMAKNILSSFIGLVLVKEEEIRISGQIWHYYLLHIEIWSQFFALTIALCVN